MNQLETYAAAIEIACAHYCVDPEDIPGPRRFRTVVLARHYTWLLLREWTELSYPEIGRLTGNDHTTIIHGVRKASQRGLAIPPRPGDQDTHAAQQDARLSSDVWPVRARVRVVNGA